MIINYHVDYPPDEEIEWDMIEQVIYFNECYLIIDNE